MTTPLQTSAPLTVSVRALCAFTARSGDLDLRFTPAPSALEGMESHRLVQGRRGDGYEAEVPLSGLFQQLTVRGRADGFDAARQQLEEIKTYRGQLDGVRPHQRALHWAQARVYGHLLCQARGLERLQVALVYVQTGRGKRPNWSKPTPPPIYRRTLRRCARATWPGRTASSSTARPAMQRWRR